VKFWAGAPPSRVGRAQAAFAEDRREAHPTGTAAMAELVEIESVVMLNWTSSPLNGGGASVFPFPRELSSQAEDRSRSVFQPWRARDFAEICIARAKAQHGCGTPELFDSFRDKNRPEGSLPEAASVPLPAN